MKQRIIDELVAYGKEHGWSEPYIKAVAPDMAERILDVLGLHEGVKSL